MADGICGARRWIKLLSFALAKYRLDSWHSMEGVCRTILDITKYQFNYDNVGAGIYGLKNI